jgi:hypothetical protein
MKIVFGLALSVSTISLIIKLPKSPGGIVFDLVQFGFSFLILITVWMSYTHIMSILPLEDSTTVILNVFLLFLVSIEPYLFYLNAVFDFSGAPVLLDAASTAYALDLAGLMVILALFTYQLTREERKLLPQELLSKYRGIMTILFFSAGLFALTTLPIFWKWTILNTPSRFYIWFVPLILSSIRRVSENQPKRE